MFLISSIVNGSEKMFLSVYAMLCSSNHARALRQDVQLGDVYKVTIRRCPPPLKSSVISTCIIIYDIYKKIYMIFGYFLDFHKLFSLLMKNLMFHNIFTRFHFVIVSSTENL